MFDSPLGEIARNVMGRRRMGSGNVEQLAHRKI
jgi:hypothetical protein